MAQFEPAYSHTSKNEGRYANDPDDSGGETYRGISRNNWPKWAGWPIIDEIKHSKGKTASIINKAAAINSVLQAKVMEFYKVNFWYPLNLQLINDQQLATNVYDFGVNAGTTRAGKFLQQAANAVCGELVVDGDVGPATVNQVNKLDGKSVYDKFNTLRGGFYDGIIKNNPTFQHSGIRSLEFT